MSSAVKVFFSQSHSVLNDELQAWLKEMAGQVTITGLSMDSNQYGHCLAVLHRTGGGPAYGGRVVFHRRHDGLEEAANQALAQAPDVTVDFMVVGSNEYGHCLCIIGR